MPNSSLKMLEGAILDADMVNTARLEKMEHFRPDMRVEDYRSLLDGSPPLTPEIEHNVKDWITRLESGQYRQIANHLRDTVLLLDGGKVEGYCCMGVGVDTLRGRWVAYHGHFRTDLAIEKGEKLKSEAYKRLGLTATTQEFLMRCNDKYGWNFTEIAQWLRVCILRERHEAQHPL